MSPRVECLRRALYRWTQAKIAMRAAARVSRRLFRFSAAAYERRALGIGSHRAFNDWGRFLPEPTTATSLLDRLRHHAVVIVTDGDSYRVRTQGGGPTP